MQSKHTITSLCSCQSDLTKHRQHPPAIWIHLYILAANEMLQRCHISAPSTLR